MSLNDLVKPGAQHGAVGCHSHVSPARASYASVPELTVAPSGKWRTETCEVHNLSYESMHVPSVSSPGMEVWAGSCPECLAIEHARSEAKRLLQVANVYADPEAIAPIAAELLQEAKGEALEENSPLTQVRQQINEIHARQTAERERVQLSDANHAEAFRLMHQPRRGWESK